MSGNLRDEMEKSRPEFCEKCGAEYKSLGFGKYLCSECGNIGYDDYGKVRDYLQKNQSVITDMIASATGVSTDFIDTLISDSLVRTADEYASGLKCQRCGHPIKEGRFCQDCIEELARAIMEQYPEKKHPIEKIKPGYRSSRRNKK